MATRPYTDEIPLSVVPPEMARSVVWELDSDDVGEPLDLAGFADRSVQVVGDLAGSTVTVQGTLVNAPDDADYATLTDVFNEPLTFTAAGLRAVAPAVRWIRPSRSAGAGTLSVYLFAVGS